MHTTIRSGLLAAIILCLFCATASAQERFLNTPEAPEVLNAGSTSFIATPSGGEFLEDGSFEAGSPNPFWNEFSTNFGTPLCIVGPCNGAVGSSANSGSWWAWFGGIGAYEEGSVDQAVTFPLGAATLSFWYEAPTCTGNPADYVELNVDGNQEWVVLGDDLLCGLVGYVQAFVDLTAYADGAVHNIEFHSEIFGPGISNFFVDDVSLTDEERPPEARFLVTKDFNDNNEAEVDVTITCNTGLPLMQPATIAEGEHVNFVVTDFEPGTLTCVVEEGSLDGYTASYNDGTVSAENCSWVEGLEGGQYVCRITNSLDEVEIEVTKVWIDENPQFNATNLAEAEWDCSNVALGGNDDGRLEFFGTPDSDTRSFFVYPDWEDGTDCSITEVDLPDGGIEIDDSDCQGLTVFPGLGASCTIINTRLYEGIPTLSQYGLAVLALLMLGVGFVGFRRFA